MAKYVINDYLRTQIRLFRIESGYRADVLSKELGKGNSYITQIENCRIHTILEDDLNEILYKLNHTISDCNQTMLEIKGHARGINRNSRKRTADYLDRLYTEKNNDCYTVATKILDLLGYQWKIGKNGKHEISSY